MKEKAADDAGFDCTPDDVETYILEVNRENGDIEIQASVHNPENRDYDNLYGVNISVTAC